MYVHALCIVQCLTQSKYSVNIGCSHYHYHNEQDRWRTLRLLESKNAGGRCHSEVWKITLGLKAHQGSAVNTWIHRASEWDSFKASCVVSSRYCQKENIEERTRKALTRCAKYPKKWTNFLQYLLGFLAQRYVGTWVFSINLASVLQIPELEVPVHELPKSDTSTFLQEEDKEGGPKLTPTAVKPFTCSLDIHTKDEKWVLIILGYHSIPRSQFLTFP